MVQGGDLLTRTNDIVNKRAKDSIMGCSNNPVRLNGGTNDETWWHANLFDLLWNDRIRFVSCYHGIEYAYDKELKRRK